MQAVPRSIPRARAELSDRHRAAESQLGKIATGFTDGEEEQVGLTKAVTAWSVATLDDCYDAATKTDSSYFHLFLEK
jgi:hypothetical protein